MPEKQPKPHYLTAEGAAKLEQELDELKGPQREAISMRLRDAIQMGDLSENADYHKAKEDQAFLEGRIQDLEFTLRNAIIVEETGKPKHVVDSWYACHRSGKRISTRRPITWSEARKPTHATARSPMILPSAEPS